MYAIEFLGYGQFTESDYEYDTGESFQHQGGRYARDLYQNRGVVKL